jgi:hypothetical protein
MARTNKRSFKHYSSEPSVQKFFVEHTQRAPVFYTGPGGRLAIFVDGSHARSGALGWETTQAGDEKTQEERQRSIILYRKEALRLAEIAFDDLKSQLEDSASFGDAEEQLEELTRLRDKARRCRRKLRRAEAALDEVTPEEVKNLRKHQAYVRQRKEEFKQRVEKIKL